MPWLLKTEPDEFSFEDLLAAPKQTARWEGVRNYQARNFLREMRLGDRVLIYHSSTTLTGIAGLARVVRERYPDPSQFDPQSPYFDAKASPDAPRWDAVDIQGAELLPRFASLGQLRAEPALQDLRLLKRGNRLSVMPVSEGELATILRLGHPT